MRSKIFLSVVGLVLVGYIGAVVAQWREQGQPAADTAWRKAWGQYGAMLQLTDKPDELFAAWQEPGAGVPVSTAEIVKRGSRIVGVIFFSGCAQNAAGLCDTEASFQVFKPDGFAYGAEEKAEVWAGKPPPPEGKLQLSVGAIGVRIEPQDPSGVYVVRARLRDNISRAEVELKRTFHVSERD